MSLSIKLSSIGPVIDTLVGVSDRRRAELQAQGRAVPGPVRVLALIDTGSMVSYVDQGLLEALELPREGAASVATVTNPNAVIFRYQVSLALLPPGSTLSLRNVAVYGSESHPPRLGVSVSALIGQDVLRHCRLFYDGPAGTFTLEHD